MYSKEAFVPTGHGKPNSPTVTKWAGCQIVYRGESQAQGTESKLGEWDVAEGWEAGPVTRPQCRWRGGK